MNQINRIAANSSKGIYIVLALICLLPFVTAPIALFVGLALAIGMGTPFAKLNKWSSKYLLQMAVVGLGFGMNIGESLQTGREGMVSTLISVAGVMSLGMIMGKWLKIGKVPSYLISTGTAICGGSAIAAVGPISGANESEMSVSLAVVFVLNSIALLVFPLLGHLASMSENQFGLWAAIAIHDTSSVVGASSVYGAEAMKIATLVKLTRALWIVPVSFFTMFFFKTRGEKVTIPWFILLFLIAMLANSYMNIPAYLSESISFASKKVLTLSLFFIGAGLSREVLRKVGVRPLFLGVLLWIAIGTLSFWTIYLIG